MTRFALYYAPAPGPFAQTAARWLARDAGGAGPVDPIDPTLWPLTQSARRYGFHATLKAPFRLAQGRDGAALIRAVDAFAAAQSRVLLDGLQLARLDGFLALIPQGATGQLDAFAAQVVRTFDPFRAPLTPPEIARRNPDALSPRQRALLDHWGYPHVFEEFRFHMTLTDRLAPDQADRVMTLAQTAFAPHLHRPVQIDALSVFAEDADGVFHLHHRAPLGS